jgi:hypothetical protein
MTVARIALPMLPRAQVESASDRFEHLSLGTLEPVVPCISPLPARPSPRPTGLRSSRTARSPRGFAARAGRCGGGPVRTMISRCARAMTISGAPERSAPDRAWRQGEGPGRRGHAGTDRRDTRGQEASSISERQAVTTCSCSLVLRPVGLDTPGQLASASELHLRDGWMPPSDHVVALLHPG